MLTRRSMLISSAAACLFSGIDQTMGKAGQPSTGEEIIPVDGAMEGRIFEGIGAISAGGSSRLLIDYPEPQRSEILDFLFKPNYGANLQHLKVEVGGDVHATDGCEPSHMHTRDLEDYHRGYEWWLMKEAKKRNPAIILGCLAWGAPFWIGNGTYYSQDMADYLVAFIQGAKRVHDLNISYVGTWNESNNVGFTWNPEWIKLLRRTLDRNNLRQVGIVAPDQVGAWSIVDDMNKDPVLKATIAAIGIHYPKSTSPQAARASGKLLWASEDGPWSGRWDASSSLALNIPALLNHNYVGGRITKTEIWALISSYYDNLPLAGAGLMRANSPWSGHYEVQPAIWAVAHTTQFAKPGWKYLDSACRIWNDGSVVAMKAPATNDYSIIIESIAAKQPQTVTIQVTGNLSSSPLCVWRSNADTQFVKQKGISPESGSGKLTLNVEPGSIYTLTTLTGQKKGATTPPPAKPFPFPYSEDFESYKVGQTPRYTIERNGVFEVVQRADAMGKALHLASTRKGIQWVKMDDPQTFLGSLDWKNYSVSADYLLNTRGNIALYGRISTIPQNADPADGYCLKVSDTGDWELRAAAKVIATGKVSFAKGVWHRLGLEFSGDSIRAPVDTAVVAQLKDETFKSGMVGLGCGWHEAQFDNLVVK